MNAGGEIRIDLVSDTSTRPTRRMRHAMANAAVGDEKRDEDPTVLALNERVAALLGKEAAIFLPSGTMCNHIALVTHCRRGDEIIAAEASHIIDFEGAGAAIFAGCLVRSIQCPHGVFSGDDVIDAVRVPNIKSPRSRLVAVEQTHNRGGGTVWALEQLASVASAARDANLKLHMDGARLMNAVVATGTPAREFAGPFDSVWLDLSKGLGCPVGGVLAGSRAFVDDAKIWKHRFGGAMRQAGVVAAAGLYALDHHIDRLAEDHRNAQRFAKRIARIDGLVVDPPEIATNLVFFDVRRTGKSVGEISRELLMNGIRIGIETASRMRAVTHMDIDRAAVDEAASVLETIVVGG